jgi:hypothetical protein
MGEVTFLPWLGLEEPTEVAGVRLLPWRDFVRMRDLAEPDREWLERYFSRYRERDGQTPVKTVTIAWCNEGDQGRMLRVVRTLAAAHLVFAHAGYLGSGNSSNAPARAERWEVFTQRFDPNHSWVALSEGYTINLLPVDSFVEIEPLNRGNSVRRLDAEVVEMTKALVRKAENDEDLTIALDLLVEGAKTSDAHVRRLNFVLLGTALELLTGAGGQPGKGRRIAERLAETVKRARCGCSAAENEREQVVMSARNVDPDLVRIWMGGCDQCDGRRCSRHVAYEGWYARRNKVVHEGRADKGVLLHQRPDNGEPHRWSIPGVGSEGARACDVALAMSGWLLLDRVGEDLSCKDWSGWCHQLDRAAEAMGMGSCR